MYGLSGTLKKEINGIEYVIQCISRAVQRAYGHHVGMRNVKTIYHRNGLPIPEMVDPSQNTRENKTQAKKIKVNY
jgi:hypothetical protein